MKHIKSYQLFESKVVIKSALMNAFDKNNTDLFKNLLAQYGDMISWQYIINRFTRVFKHNQLGFIKHIESEEGLEALKSITTLSIGHKKVTDLEGIEKLPNLKALYCNNNKITSLKPLIVLHKLQTLDFNWNKVTDLEGIKHLGEKITGLYCKNNEITTLDGIQEFIYLDDMDFTAKNNPLPEEIREKRLKRIQEYYNLRNYYGTQD